MNTIGLQTISIVNMRGITVLWKKRKLELQGEFNNYLDCMVISRCSFSLQKYIHEPINIFVLLHLFLTNMKYICNCVVL